MASPHALPFSIRTVVNGQPASEFTVNGHRAFAILPPGGAVETVQP